MAAASRRRRTAAAGAGPRPVRFDPARAVLPAGESRTRRPERPILLACASVGAMFAALAVLERVGVERTVLGTLAVALPLAAVAVLALMGRTIDRLPFVVDGARGGALGNGLALGGEWMGVWLVPAAVLLPAATGGGTGVTAPLVLGSAVGLVCLAVAVAGAVRRAGALSAASFVALRTQSAWAGLAVALPAAAAICGLAVFQMALLRALLVPFVDGSADTALWLLASAAALVCLVGGQRSLTLVSAFLAFFLALAVVVPALSALAGIEGMSATLPLDRLFAAALPGAPSVAAAPGAGAVAGWAGSLGALAQFAALALAALALPTFTLRLASVRPGAPTQATAWAMLAGYVVFTAAAIAFGRLAGTAGLAVNVHGQTSILSELPALGWLGAVWAGLAMSMFALAALVAQDLRVRRRSPALGWADMRAVVTMRLVFIALPPVLLFAGLREGWFAQLDVDAARLAAGVCVVAAAGSIAPPLVLAIHWRWITAPAVVLAQVAAAAVAFATWPLATPVAVALATAGTNVLVLFLAGRLTPRRMRPDLAALAALRDP